ncbi:MAG: efflux RND transporter periplasmic adaptor subunit [Pseudomonadales bacterium]|nr:efflux RND transporter periplasmic adaptor subunit [Pseudomonadales bacterium]
MVLTSSEKPNPKSDLLNGLRLERHDREHKPRSTYKLLLAMLVLAGLGIGWFLLPDGLPSNATAVALGAAENTPVSIEPVAPIQNSEVNAADAATVLDATGYVAARRQATVSAQITGKVVDVLIEEGDVVAQGQLLARLDDDLLFAQYQLSEAQLEAAKAGLLEFTIKNREAQLNLDRVRQLANRSLASQAELDQALLDQQSALARMERINQEIQVAEKSLHLQAQQLAQTEIRAPFAGVVVNKAAQPGEIISPMSAGGGFTRTGICSLVDMDSLEIEVDVSESNINRIFSGQQVVARLNSHPDSEIPAEVITIIPAADRSRATVKVRIRFLDNDSRILPDMGVRVSFLEKELNTDLDSSSG